MINHAFLHALIRNTHKHAHHKVNNVCKSSERQGKGNEIEFGNDLLILNVEMHMFLIIKLQNH